MIGRMLWWVVEQTEYVLFALGVFVIVSSELGLDLPPREPALVKCGLGVAWVFLALNLHDLEKERRRSRRLEEKLDEARKQLRREVGR